ncbi:hypothetical protein C8J57DRAFT_1245104 [Mycena rebaudengoi]|nr:hypothetical protein C8J57DRAFT_1245104 [Mycena rebaudengoi]
MLGHTREILLSAALSVVSDLATPHPSFMKSAHKQHRMMLSSSVSDFTEKKWIGRYIHKFACFHKCLFCLHHQIVHREDRLAVEISVWVVNIDMGSNSHMTVPVEFR